MLLSDVTYNAIIGFGNLATNPGSGINALNRFESVISMVIGIITVIGGIWFTFQILIGSYQWITAGSDKDAVTRAQKRFTNSFMGLVVLIFAYTLIALVGKTLGLNIFQFASTVNSIAKP